VRDLLARLDDAASASRILARLESDLMHAQPPSVLLEPSTPLHDLGRIKESSKLFAAGTQDAERRATGLLGYFLCVAAALRNHGQLISSQDRMTVNETLLELSGVLHGPLAMLCAEAALSPIKDKGPKP